MYRAVPHVTARQLALGALCAAVAHVGVAQATAQEGNEMGITGVTASDADLTVPTEAPEGETLRYGLGFPFQLSATEAALFCNLRVEGVPVYDFEAGTDVVIFDHLGHISAEDATPISRNERRQHPELGPRIIVKYPVIGGFVPVGALQEDGSPHPDAGTGFGICQAISFPVNEDGYFGWDTERIHRTEVHQLSYDGAHFHSVRSQSGLEGETHPRVGESGWSIVAPGITNAIPDGDDLLQPVLAYDGTVQRCGVARWQRSDGVWRPLAFSPVSPAGESWTEPSMVRDVDGALLFSARGYGEAPSNEVRVWRRARGTSEWRLVIDVQDARHQAPVSIGRAADGTPFIGANLLGSGREVLQLWPLNPERTEVEEPITIRDAPAQFGSPGEDSRWMVDHPSAAVVRLADGRWHALLAYRILHSDEHHGAQPAPQTGCYVEEVTSAGPPVSPWRFE
ncbi:MAG: hypothetical protein U9R79_16530 [Armatimonadota bacterium]|nr:hypothetical protein [Armatimonadota bacterium]